MGAWGIKALERDEGLDVLDILKNEYVPEHPVMDLGEMIELMKEEVMLGSDFSQIDFLFDNTAMALAELYFQWKDNSKLDYDHEEAIWDKVTGFTASKEALAFLLRQLTDIKNEVPDEDGIREIVDLWKNEDSGEIAPAWLEHLNQLIDRLDSEQEARQQVGGHLAHGQAVQIGHHVQAVIVRLQQCPVAHRADIVAQSGRAGGLNARKNAFAFFFCHGTLSPFVINHFFNAREEYALFVFRRRRHRAHPAQSSRLNGRHLHGIYGDAIDRLLAEPFSHANFHAGLGSSCVFVYNIEYNQTEDICQCFTPLKLIVLCEGMLQLWSKFYSCATATSAAVRWRSL